MFLGIDIGSSKVAAVLLNEGGDIGAVVSAGHEADLPAPPGRHEQDPARLLEAAWDAVKSLPWDLRQKTAAIGVTGQMHGILLLGRNRKILTPLLTWQDQRCLEDPSFLAKLSSHTPYPLAAGYGCATLAWLIQNNGIPAEARYTATIQDLAVAVLCGQPKPYMDPTNGASWGLFDLERLGWDQNAVKATGIPVDWLPEILPCGARTGTLDEVMSSVLGLPQGIPVAVAIGDNQASILATLNDPEKQLALTLGTGGQISAVLSPDARLEIYGGQHDTGTEMPRGREPRPEWKFPFEYRPFPGNRYALVAACLCGGSAWRWLAESINSWLGELELPTLSAERLYHRLNELGLKAPNENSLSIQPHFLGERYDVSLRGVIKGIDPGNFQLGILAKALARGIFQNLHQMLPAFAYAGRTQMVASGNALARNPLLTKMASEVFSLPILFKDLREEAACGAALLAKQLATSSKS
jgi:sedoheptulokinase